MFSEATARCFNDLSRQAHLMGPSVGDVVLGGRYVLLAQVRGSLGKGKVRIGVPGRCRYCGAMSPERFRNVAHTFPEALGNKWVESLDECDDCNGHFSVYDEALANSVSPLLTLGGTKGKDNKVRQTGRSAGASVVTRRQGQDRSKIEVRVRTDDPAAHAVAIDPASGRLRMEMPIAGVPFKPRHAYKALCKMAIAMLPESELGRYQKLRDWLLIVDDEVEFPILEVAMSFGSIGNAPPLVVGTLLRRAEPTDPLPYLLFVFSAGPVCLQIALMSDHEEDHYGFSHCGSISIDWVNVVGNDDLSESVRIEYGKPIHRNWSGASAIAQPVRAMVLDFDQATCEGRFTPIFWPGSAERLGD